MSKKGYRGKEKFTRISMSKEVKTYEEDVLKELISKCDKLPRKKDAEFYKKQCKGLIATLFLTGGRIMEVLMLKKKNFNFSEEEAKSNDSFLVKNMKVLKANRNGKPINLTRTFPIWYNDPTVNSLLEWLDELSDDQYLFSTSRKLRMSPTTAFKMVRDVGELLERPLHINTIWFRKQREFYLVNNRGFSNYDLQAYFKFTTTPKIPRTRKDWQNLLYVSLPQKTDSAKSLVKNGLNINELKKLANKKPCMFFPDDVWKKLTDIEKNDFSDSAKCLLEGLATPAAMVAWRGSEASIKHYYKLVTGKNPDEKATWRKLTRELQKKANDYGLKDNFASHLDYYGDTKRNFVLHPNKNFSMNEATTFFMQVVGLVSDIYSTI